MVVEFMVGTKAFFLPNVAPVVDAISRDDLACGDMYTRIEIHTFTRM